jgi:GPH family glycoside/pentoside/hexuronide:cation symporter
MSEKWGKKKTFMISQAISILGYILFWFLFIPGKPYMFLFALPLFSFGIGGLFTLMMSMTADTCDLDELNNGLPRKEATFGAIYWWMVKFGTALAGLFSGIIMSYVGFDANLSAQPDGAMTGLRIFYSVLPVIGTAIAIYVMKNYDINEARAKEISETLNKRNAK